MIFVNNAVAGIRWKQGLWGAEVDVGVIQKGWKSWAAFCFGR